MCSAVAPFIFFGAKTLLKKKEWRKEWSEWRFFQKNGENGEKNGENGDFSKRMERMESVFLVCPFLFFWCENASEKKRMEKRMERMEIFPKEWREWRKEWREWRFFKKNGENGECVPRLSIFVFFGAKTLLKKKNGEKNGENGDFSKRMERMEKRMERMEIFQKEWREWRVCSSFVHFCFFGAKTLLKKKNEEKNGENGDFSKRMEII